MGNIFYPLHYTYSWRPIADYAIGLDNSDIPERWNAMKKSRDLGITIVSKPHYLPADPDKRTGIVMVSPVFDAERPSRTVSERRSALSGFIISSFLVEDIINGIMGPSFKTRFDLEVLQAPFNGPSARNVIYDGGRDPHVLNFDGSLLARQGVINFAGQRWSLYFFLRSPINQNELLKPALLIISTGLLLSIALALVVWRLQHYRRLKRLMHRQDEYFEAMFDSHIVGVYLVDLQRRIVNANARFSKDLGVRKEDLVGGLIDTYIDPDYLEGTLKYYRDALNGTAVAYQNLVITATGRRIHFSIILIPVSTEGKVTRLLGVAKNITARALEEREVRETKKMLQQVIDNIPQRVFWKDLDFVYLGCNSKLCTDIGVNDSCEIVGKTDYELPWAVHADRFRKNDQEVIGTGCPKLNREEAYPDTGGAEKWERYSKIPLTDDAGDIIGILGLSEDITERKSLEQKLVYMAHYDTLTGLFNRAYFYEQLDKVISRHKRRGSSFAFMYFDIDNFKIINDTHGHDIGDAVIRMFSERVASMIREVDVLGRLGGDEFALIIEDLASIHSAEVVANKILEAMRPPFEVRELELNISTSIGVAIYKMGMEADDLVSSADQAMYKAKQSGRSRFELAR